MFYLERQETLSTGYSWAEPITLWKPIYLCLEKWPLELMMNYLCSGKYRITDTASENGGTMKGANFYEQQHEHY